MAQVSIVTVARKGEAAVAAAEKEEVVLNPCAREFLPWWRLGSSVKRLSVDAPEFVPAPDAAGGKNAARGIVRTERRRVDHKNGQDARRPRASAFTKVRRSVWREAVKRTIFVHDIDHSVTEDMLAALFGFYGTVMDYRIYGDPTSGFRFAFVELQNEDEAYAAAIFLDGTIIGLCPLRVSLSRTAIYPINPKFLPQSEAEQEMCLRTVYCTNISKIIKSCNLKGFCEAYFGKVCRLKLLEKERHSTNVAFIEFAEVNGATAALEFSGICAGGIPFRMCRSRTPIRDHDVAVVS